MGLANMTSNRKTGAGSEAIKSWDSRMGGSATGGTVVVLLAVGDGGDMTMLTHYML